MRKEKWVLVGDSHEIVADVVEKKNVQSIIE
jgi:hypothetical protein